MNDVATLLTAVGGLTTALAGAFALVWNTVRLSKRERPDTARRVVEVLAAAAEDGEITADELAQLAEHLGDAGGEDA